MLKSEREALIRSLESDTGFPWEFAVERLGEEHHPDSYEPLAAALARRLRSLELRDGEADGGDDRSLVASPNSSPANLARLASALGRYRDPRARGVLDATLARLTDGYDEDSVN